MGAKRSFTAVLANDEMKVVEHVIGLNPLREKRGKRKVFVYLSDVFKRLPISIEEVLSEWVVFRFENCSDYKLVSDARNCIYGVTDNLAIRGKYKAETKIIIKDKDIELWARKVVGKPKIVRGFTIEELKTRAKDPQWWM